MAIIGGCLLFVYCRIRSGWKIFSTKLLVIERAEGEQGIGVFQGEIRRVFPAISRVLQGRRRVPTGFPGGSRVFLTIIIDFTHFPRKSIIRDPWGGKCV